MSHEQEIQQLREEIHQLREKLEDVSRRLEQLRQPATPPPLPQPSVPPIVAAVADRGPSSPTVPTSPPRSPAFAEATADKPPAATELPPIIAPPPPSTIAHGPSPIPPSESFEVRLGTVWLSRIGMALLLTGMAFFAAHYFPRLTAAHKVALSYGCGALLCGLGVWLEKRTTPLARVLFGGGLALIYFVTYAAHHVAAFRVIQSPALALTLLSVVVVAIIASAQNRQSPVLAGLALFFGYYTSIISEVATFTLAANAVLALAALFFLWRNRWVPISYLAVLATYLAYLLWVWQLNRGVELGQLLFDRGYLAPEDFRLRAAFLSLYWLLFAAGGLIARRDALELPERNGLLTLNNAFFFILFALLMHHAWPDRQWVFLFGYGGLLLVTAALAGQRFAPERGPMDLLFLQGVIVTTLGVLDYFENVHLVAALAAESLLLLLLARTMPSRSVAWIARAVYLAAFVIALGHAPEWNSRMIWAAWFAAAAGLVAARVEGRAAVGAISNRARPALSAGGGSRIQFAPTYFALLATTLAMVAAGQRFPPAALRWVWLAGAVLIAGLGGALRTREIVWAAHVPLAWAFLKFLGAVDDRFWPLDQSLALIAGLFGFGVVAWGRERASENALRPVSERSVVLPYAITAMIAVVMTTVQYCPVHWRLAAFAVETAVLVGAGVVVRERTFFWLGVAAAVVGCLKYLGDCRAAFDSRYDGWVNLACSLWILGGIENFLEWRGFRLGLRDKTMRIVAVGIITIMAGQAIFAIRYLVDKPLLSVSWAMCGFAFLVVGFATKERAYRIGGLVALAFALLRVISYDVRQLSTPYRILTFIALGAMLLVLAFLYARAREKLVRWL